MSCFDAVVIGGGPAGSVSALLLARAGWSVALLERAPFPRRKVCGEYLSATNWPLLERLGLDGALEDAAGPEVRRVGLAAGASLLSAGLPRPPGARWGRALSRERLDPLLLGRAAAAGVEVLQPFTAREAREEGEEVLVRAEPPGGGEARWLRAPIVLGAHGSWEPGPLPTQSARSSARAGDLLGFKVHLLEVALPPDLMPLLAFEGGYGGMAACEGGRFSLSACIRRDALERARSGGLPAGEALLSHILERCPALRPALDGAVPEGPWLSAGPIRPGLRRPHRSGVFAVGNAAAEAHPVVAEGITMALQSACLLAGILAPRRSLLRSREVREAAAREYGRALRRNCAPRIRAASIIARWAMRPVGVRASLPAIARFPALLTWGARWAGKARQLVPD